MVAPADPHPGPARAEPDARPPTNGLRTDGSTAASPSPPPTDDSRTGGAPGRPSDGPSTSDRAGEAAASPPGKDADPHCLPPGEADQLLADAPWRRFLVLGNGMAAADGDEVAGYFDAGWGEQVAAALARQHPDLAYQGLGERERRIAEVRETQLEVALDFRPDLALVVAGGDDILRRDFERCDDVVTDHDAIVTALQRAGADVVTVTIFDVTRSARVPDACRAQLRHRLDELAGRVRQVALARGTLHLDLSSHPAAELADIYGADLRFLSRRGQAIAAAALIRRLGEHLAGSGRS